MKTPPLLPPWLLLATAAVILLALCVTCGCSSIPADLRAHEERHCDGWSHTGEAPFYRWERTRPASVKPWLYVMVDDVDRVCRDVGTSAEGLSRINACATWKPVNCVIYLPRN